jgi:hypothetical protein
LPQSRKERQVLNDFLCALCAFAVRKVFIKGLSVFSGSSGEFRVRLFPTLPDEATTII